MVKGFVGRDYTQITQITQKENDHKTAPEEQMQVFVRVLLNL